MISITFLGPEGGEAAPRIVTAPLESNLLRVSLREKGGIPFKCGGGLCGTCKCKVTAGAENLDAIKPKERRHLTEEELAAGWRMACQTFVQQGTVSITWPAPPPKPGSPAT
jgi:ferredoxin